MLMDLFLKAWETCSYLPRTAFPGIVPPTMSWGLTVINQETIPEAWPHADLVGHFLIWGFIFQNDSSQCQVDIKKKKKRPSQNIIQIQPLLKWSFLQETHSDPLLSTKCLDFNYFMPPILFLHHSSYKNIIPNGDIRIITRQEDCVTWCVFHNQLHVRLPQKYIKWL